MNLRTDRRGQSIQIGAVLLFGVAIVAFSTYQATMVQSQNAETEFQHSQSVQSQMVTVRNTIATPDDVGVSADMEVELGTSYSSRIVGINPGDPSGTLRTVGTENADIDLQIKNAETVQGTPSFWDGDTSFNTGALVYEPEYNEYRAPETVYEHKALYNDGAGSNPTTLAAPSMISGNNIDLVLLNGSVFESGSGTVSVEATTVDKSKKPLHLTNSGSDPLEITFHSRQSASYWERLAEGEKGAEITAVSSTPDPDIDGWHEVTITLDTDVTYDVRLTKVGVGEQVADPEEDGTKISMVAADSVYQTRFEDWSRHPLPTTECDDGRRTSPLPNVRMIGGECNFGDGASTERTYTLSPGTYEIGFTYHSRMSWDSGGSGYTCCGNNEQGELYMNGELLWDEDFAQGKYTKKFTSGGDVTFRFTSNINQGAGDESFGINNVWIRHIDNSEDVD